MSFVIAAPEAIAAAASNLASIGSTITAANAAAAGSTTGVLPAAADEVSAAIARLFGTYAQDFQALRAQAEAFHDRFVQALTAGEGSYIAAEAANAARMQDALNVLNAPIRAVTGGLGWPGGAASSVAAADAAAAATSYNESYFANLPTLPFRIGAFDLNLGNLRIYNHGGILPWQFGFGMDLLNQNPMVKLIAESEGNAYGIASLVSAEFNALGFSNIGFSNIQAYGNVLDGNNCIISDQFTLYGPGWTNVFRAKTGIFTNALPAFEWSTPLLSSQTGSPISNLRFPLGSPQY
jgi:hypothetical protein